jgi:hypothetical protein
MERFRYHGQMPRLSVTSATRSIVRQCRDPKGRWSDRALPFAGLRLPFALGERRGPERLPSLDDGARGVVDLMLEFPVDRLQVASLVSDVLNPFEATHGHPAGVGQDIGGDWNAPLR